MPRTLLSRPRHAKTLVCGAQLADIAEEMDRREREALAGSGLESESGNVRADGFFSVQV